MKSKWMFAASIMLAATSLAGCGEQKTQIGILQFGSFPALENARIGFEETIKASSIAGKVEIRVMNPAANSADNTSMASTLAASSDLLYGIATPSAGALKNAVDSLGSGAPVIFSAVTNAIGANLVQNLEKPEGNCTGVLDIGPIADELDILTKFPDIDKVCSFYTQTEVNSIYQVEIAEEWMGKHNISFSRKTITNASEIGTAFAAIPEDVDAVFLPTDDTIANAIVSIQTANEARTSPLIIVGSDTGMIEGCTFALGVDYKQCGKQAAAMAIKIIGEGKKIADIPVETCDLKNIVINTTEAAKLGIIIPQEVLSIEGATTK